VKARATWTRPTDIRARVRRRWDDGSLLRAYAAGEPFPVIEVPLRGPRVSEIGVDLGAVQDWSAALESGRHEDRHYTLSYSDVGGRLIGRNQLPRHATVSSYEHAWALLGVTAQVGRCDEVLQLTAVEPVVRAWVAAHPLKAVSLHAEWPQLLSAYRWLDDHRESGRYLREITAPGVDTKLVERHRGVLAALLGVSTSSTAFLLELGLTARPELLRLRAHPGTFGSLSDVTARVDELRAATISVRSAVIVENEITFLSTPVPCDGVVLWGKGFEVDRSGSLPWLRSADVHYWGDLDTHGFAILNQLRAWLPQTHSFLMDRPTLLEHRERWGHESTPTRARLDRLSSDEAAVYDDLVSDRLGDRVRLEQERIDWAWAEPRFPLS
jgi:hypothetical protein